MSDEEPSIGVAKNGPFLVKGTVRLTDAAGLEIEASTGVVALCRCGASKKKPFCDGSHTASGFTGGEPPVTRSHYTLCRCGASKNKPFCDGAHKKVGFED